MYGVTASSFRILKSLLVETKRAANSNMSSIIAEHLLQRHHHLSSTYPGFPGRVQKMVQNGGDHITRVLFCGPYFPASHNYTREYLQSHSFIQVDDVSLDDVPDVIGNYDICVVKSMRLNSDIIQRAKRMKLIMQYGVGLEGVDIDAATEHSIKVARIPSGATGNATSCAEMAIYLMLGLLRKQVFILGFGDLGVHLAQRLRPFGVKILATKRSWYMQKSGQANATRIEDSIYYDLVDEKGTHADILEFASKADIVVCCLRMNSETVGVVDKTFLSSMRKGAILVNIARGGILDYDAVLNHLRSGHLGGLGIDVAWTEPFDPNDAILQFPNVIMTPHVAGVTEYAYRYMAKVVGNVALRLHAGEPLTEIEIVN